MLRVLAWPRRQMAALLLLSALAGAAGVARLGGDARLLVAFLIEAPLVAAGLWWTCRLTCDRFSEQTLAHPAVRAAFVLLLLLAVGQLIKQKQTYPFLAYTMYGTAAAGDITYYEYEALLTSGLRQRFRPSSLQPALGSARIARGLAQRLDASLVDGRLDRHHRAYVLFESALRALAELYDEDSPADPLARVEIFRVTWPVPLGSAEARRERLGSVEMRPR
jgi:hypothetical protein